MVLIKLTSISLFVLISLQIPSQKVVDKSLIVPINSVLASESNQDLKELIPLFQDKRVIAMGEATHGTREFSQMKHRMFKFLVEEMGFTIFAIEGTFAYALAVNDYILSGKGDPYDAISQMRFWASETEEVLELVEWMKEYNLTATDSSKIKFYGIDAGFCKGSVFRIYDYLKKVDSSYFRKAKIELKPFEENPYTFMYPSLSGEEKESNGDKLKNLISHIENNKLEYIKNSSQKDWEISLQLARVLQQTHTESMVNNINKNIVIRDHNMADNIEWMLQYEGADAKLMIWAHNAHVSKNFGYNTVGKILSERLQGQFYSIGFVFDQGSFLAESRKGLQKFSLPSAPKGTFSNHLSKASEPLFFIDFNLFDISSKNNKWLSKKHKYYQIEAYHSHSKRFVKTNFVTSYDGLIFIEKTTHSKSFAKSVRFADQ